MEICNIKLRIAQITSKYDCIIEPLKKYFLFLFMKTVFIYLIFVILWLFCFPIWNMMFQTNFILAALIFSQHCLMYSVTLAKPHFLLIWPFTLEKNGNLSFCSRDSLTCLLIHHDHVQEALPLFGIVTLTHSRNSVL